MNIKNLLVSMAVILALMSIGVKGEAGTITVPNTFTAGTAAVAAEVNSNFTTIYNEFNGSIANVNVDASAAIAYSKLNLSSSLVAADVSSGIGLLGTAAAWTADQTFNDNVNLTFGTGGDADIDYDGTNLVINPTVVGTGFISIIGTIPQIRLGDGGTEDTILSFDGNAVDFYIGLDDTTDSLVIGLDFLPGTNPAITISGDGTEDVTLAGDLTVSGAGPHAIGGVTSSSYALRIAGSFTPAVSGGAGILFTHNLTSGNNENTYGLEVNPTIIEHSAGTHVLLSAINVRPIFTNGVATATTVAGLTIGRTAFAAPSAGTTNAANIYLANPPTGATNNFALWVDDGDVKIDDNLALGTSTNTGVAGDLIMSGDLSIAGVGPHAIGGVVANNIRLGLLGSFTSLGAGTESQLVSVTGVLTLADGDTGDQAHMVISGSVVTQDANDINNTISTLHLDEPVITVTAGGTVARSAALYIAGAATEATNDWSMLISSGRAGISGLNGADGGQLWLYRTDPTIGSTDVLGTLMFDGFESSTSGLSTLDASAMIQAIAIETFGPNDHGASLLFFVKALDTNIEEAATERMRLGAQGALFVGDNANGNMTIGLTINQAQNDDIILDFKSPTDVAHGGVGLFTTAETDTFAHFRKVGGGGGLVIEVMQDSTTDDRGLVLVGLTLDADVDTVDTATQATLMFFASQHDSSGTIVDMEADANIFAVIGRVGSGNRTVFVVNEDGDTFIDGTGPTVFDSHRDAELLTKFESFYIAGRKEADFDTMMASHNHAELFAAGLVGELNKEDWNAGVRPLVPLSAQLTLLSGTARQEHAIMNALMDVLEEDPQFRGKMIAAMNSRGIGHLARPQLP